MFSECSYFVKEKKFFKIFKNIKLLAFYLWFRLSTTNFEVQRKIHFAPSIHGFRMFHHPHQLENCMANWSCVWSLLRPDERFELFTSFFLTRNFSSSTNALVLPACLERPQHNWHYYGNHDRSFVLCRRSVRLSWSNRVPMKEHSNPIQCDLPYRTLALQESFGLCNKI